MNVNRVKIENFGGTITTNASGNATATSYLKVNGRIEAIRVELGTATSADVQVNPTGLTDTNSLILNVTGVSSTTTYYPRIQVHKADGTQVSTYTEFIVNGHLTLTVSNAGANKTLKVTIYYV